MEYCKISEIMSGRRDLISSIESIDSDIAMNPEGRALNQAVEAFYDHHMNGR